MAAISWNEKYSVKVSSIDKQHQKLFDLINEFYDNLSNNSNNDLILNLVTGMGSYVDMHFKTEEKYMQEFNYPGFELHKKEHDAFIAKVKDFEDLIRKGVTIVSFEITSFLKDWIKKHILCTDMQYSEFFTKNGIR